MSPFASRSLATLPDTLAPDGSEVRLLVSLPEASMAHFTLAGGAVARAVVHRTVAELWYFVAGRGRMWRRSGNAEETVEVSAGVSITIPVGTQFQFRADGGAPLQAVGVTIPPWPGPDEAVFVEGPWQPAS